MIIFGDTRRLRRIEQRTDVGLEKLDQLLRRMNTMVDRIKNVEKKFDEYVAKVTQLMTTIEEAKAEAVRADDAGEDDALAGLVNKIDAAMAELPADFDPSANE